MLVRLACCVILAAALLIPAAARAGCADEISKVMSKDTEKLTTRYNRITRQIQERGSNPRLRAEECRIARALTPRLQGQLAALKESGCIKDTEKLTTRYNRITRQIQERGSNPRLRAEECRIARALTPRLQGQLAALKESGCIKDPQMGNMIADIVRGHEDDLAMALKTASRSECR